MKDNYLIFNYWMEYQLGGEKKTQWTTLQHNGVIFPPEYISHGIPILYKGEEIILNPEEEEVATFYAKYIETEYIKSSKFRRNFWKDWKKILLGGSNNNIQSLDDCDFTLIHKHLEKERLKKLDISKEEKERIKKEEQDKESKYMVVIM